MHEVWRFSGALAGTVRRRFSEMALALALAVLAAAPLAIAADQSADVVGSEREPQKYKNLDSILKGILAKYEQRVQSLAVPEAPLKEAPARDARSGAEGAAPEDPAPRDAVPDERVRQEAAREAASQAPMHKEGSVAVTFHVQSAAHAEALAKFLSDNGGSPRNWGEDYVEAYVPVPLLGAASRRPGVLRVQAMVPPRPFFGPIVSEGVAVHKALAWHSAGFKGQGVKVGVIDGGFDGITKREILGAELPANITARCYTGLGTYTSNIEDCDETGTRGGNIHGTGVAEALLDMAPDAQLYIAQPDSKADLRNTMNWMASQGVQVINFSVGYLFDGPGDGSSPLSISPLNTVDEAVRQGIVWASAAGNSGEDSWYGPFKDSNGDGWHEFQADSTDPCNSVALGGNVTIQLRWQDDWGNATRDLDLQILSADGTEVIGGSAQRQDGSEGATPYELIGLQGEGDACLQIEHKSGARPGWVQLLVWGPISLGYGTFSGSISNPAESANPGHLTVGAAGQSNTNLIQTFSSRGPAPDGRLKPDLVGADYGNSAIRGHWLGTSQASPHLAGLAALVLSAYPNHSPARVAAFLKGNAKDRGINGPDNDWGHGFAELPAPPSDANLDSLSLSPGSLSPGFSADIIQYTASVASTVAQVTVTATEGMDATSLEITPADADAGAPGHQVDLTQGSNDIFLAVTGASDTRKTYRLRVVRGSANLDLSWLSLSQGNLNPAFSRGVTDYSTRVGDDRTATRVTVTAIKADDGATISIMPMDLDADQAGHQVPLAAGANSISVQLNSPDGMTSKTYRIQATRAATPANQAPTADAGADQKVQEDEIATLQGGGSDPEGTPLTYRWRQRSGPAVTLSNAQARNPTFRAPNLLADATLVFALWVSDGLQDSVVPALVRIHVQADNDPPKADAGSDLRLAQQSTGTLDGGASSDPEGQDLTYAWTQTAGPTVTLDNAASLRATFQAPNADATLTFRLVVSDGDNSSDPDYATMQVDGTLVDHDDDEDGLIEIRTPAQLNAMRWDRDGSGQPASAFLDEYLAAFQSPATHMGCPAGRCKGYELGADLDLNVTPHNAGPGWLPIGAPFASQPGVNNLYKGIFQGNGHRIANLYINRRAEDRQGLFASLDSQAKVEGVKLVNANVAGHRRVGGLAGDNSAAIVGCSVTGNITGREVVGGLVGRNNPNGTIAASSADAIVSADISMAGGLAGAADGSIVASHAGGEIRSNRMVGGLVGILPRGRVAASYATGTVGGGQEVGGLVGRHGHPGTERPGRIIASYATGAVSGHIAVGGLTGSSLFSVTTSSYWDTETTGQAKSASGIGKTTSELQTPIAYGSASSMPPSIYAGWNLNLDGEAGSDDPWHFGTGSQYPVLKYGGLDSDAQFAAQGSPPASAALGGLSLSAGGASAPLGPAFDAAVAAYGANLAIDQTRAKVAATAAQAGAIVQITPADADPNADGHQLDLASRRTVVGIAVTSADGTATRIYGLRIVRGGHDADLDGLIEISTAAQLQFLEWDREGDGAPWSGKGDEQAALFPNVQDLPVIDSGVELISGGKVEGLICPIVCLGYELVADLDLDMAPYNRGAGWPSLAAEDVRRTFDGIFDGNGHEIANLFVDRAQAAGLFGHVGGRIERLRLTNVNVSGDLWAGGLAGTVFSDGIIAAVSVTGAISGKNRTGGLVGANQGAIKASHVNASVLGDRLAGGLAGINYETGTIAASYTAGIVQGSVEIGGLTGANLGSIQASYATGSVVGRSGAGGLVGSRTRSFGTLADSYWDRQTTGQPTSAGSDASAGKTTSDLQDPQGYSGIYANWNLDLDGDGEGDDPWHFGTNRQYPVLQYGGLDADAQFAAQVLSRETELSALNISPGILSPAFSSATPAYAGVVASSQRQVTVTAQVRNPGAAIRISPVDANPGAAGHQVHLTEAFTLIVVVVTSPDGASQRTYLVNLSRGTQDADLDGLIEISTVAQLNAVRWDLNGDGAPDNVLKDAGSYAEAFSSPISGAICPLGCSGYELIRDLDLGIAPYNEGAGWAPIGVSERAPFQAVFEGNGRRISNLFIDNGTDRVVGLFGFIDGSAPQHSPAIRRLALTDVDVRGIGAVGGLLGWNFQGAVIASSVTGSIDGGQTGNAGGLIGTNQGTISASWAKAGVRAGVAGGLAAINLGAIVASYAAGDATGGTAGGLVGGNYGGSIAASYAIGAVAPAVPGAIAQGLVGQDLGGTVADSYWNTETSGQSASAAGIGKTTSELQSPTGYAETIYADWNLDLDGDGNDDDPWDFGSASQYPALKYLNGSLGLAAQDPSRDATLSSLRFDPPPLSLTPAFSPRIVAYAGVVDRKLRSMTVHAAPARDGASLSILPADLDGDANNGHQIALNGEDQVALAIRVTAQDGATALTYRATLAPDSAPMFAVQVPDQVWRAGEKILPLTLPLATGGDGTLTYALAPPLPAGLTLAGRVISGAPQRQQPYSTYTWMATDADGDLTGLTFGILVEPPNQAPIPVGEIADLELIVGASKTVDLADLFRDPDGDALQHSAATDNPAVATARVVDGDAVRVVGQSPGATQVTVTATDPYGKKATLSFRLKVERSMRGRWQGWRTILLKPDEEDEGS